MPYSNSLSNKSELSITDFTKQNLIFVDNDLTGIEMINLQNKIINENTNLNVTFTNDLAGALILVSALQGITIGLKFIYTDFDEQLKKVPLALSPTISYGAVVKKNNKRQVVKQFIDFLQNEL